MFTQSFGTSLDRLELPAFAKTSRTGQSPERTPVADEEDYYYQKCTDDVEGTSSDVDYHEFNATATEGELSDSLKDDSSSENDELLDRNYISKRPAFHWKKVHHPRINYLKTLVHSG